MAALTGPRNTPELSDGGRIIVYGVEASTSIHLGGMVALDSSGYAVPAASMAGLTVIGRAEYVYAQGIMPPGIDALNEAASAALFPQITNLGNAGAIGVGARRGIFNYDNDSSVVAASAGQMCFAVDDHTVSATDGGSATAVSEEAHTIPASGPLIVQLTHPVNVSGIVVQNSGNNTTYVLGTDYYIIDAADGIIGFMGSTLVASTVVHISYNYGAASRPVAGRVAYIDAIGVWVDFWHQSIPAV